VQPANPISFCGSEMARQVIHNPIEFFARCLRPTICLRVHFPLPLPPRQPQFRGIRGLVAARAHPHENFLARSIRIRLQILALNGQEHKKSNTRQYETPSQSRIISSIKEPRT
jgi:hypothetical protein